MEVCKLAQKSVTYSTNTSSKGLEVFRLVVLQLLLVEYSGVLCFFGVFSRPAARTFEGGSGRGAEF